MYRQEPEVFAALEKRRPDDPLLPLVRGRALGMQSKWQDAKKAYGSIIQAIPASEDWYEYAALCLLSGDRKAAQDHIAWMAKQKDQPASDFLSYCYGRAASLVDDPRYRKQAVTWAETGFSKQRTPWYLHAAGLAYYRAGQWDKAKETLQEALRGSWGCQYLNQLALAMVEHKLGNDKAAQDLLDTVHKLHQGFESNKPGGYVNMLVTDWVEFNVLLPELEGMLAKTSGP